ncbi:MAG: Fe-S cluster assembly ATPase SufC [SAR202 cluster bacterium]|nr:Fe-S cluster assembly ATPase SufC [Chloroflexota bacterium]MQG38565.1 Fe-S cluster assembly ATPase SufC [SAR202 cluster bacterium]|tara:strand:+ start:1009 stop:1749 length:741 start_codon:yes stop_codon:yes gene_type:complete
MLQINDLHVSIGETQIINGISLSINSGETHAVMGPNGSGKSTLANVIAGNPNYSVTKGEIIYKGNNIVEMPPDERSKEGVFLAFQYPVEIPGVKNRQFLKTALDAKRVHSGQAEMPIREFNKLYQEKIKLVGMKSELSKRFVNDGFSGGEKKRNEILQLAVLQPQLALLDETDSGLDIDALKTIAESVKILQNPDLSIMLVTHYQRILTYITPDYVHVLMDGKIVKSGDHKLAEQLEQKGYDWLKK